MVHDKEQLQIEFEWLLQQLNLTNKALVPVLNATRLKEIWTGIEGAQEEEVGCEKQKEASSVEDSAEVDSGEETKLESHFVMKITPEDDTKADILISKKVPESNDPQSIVDVLDTFFDVQASTDDPEALQHIVDANRAELVSKVVDINRGRLDQIID